MPGFTFDPIRPNTRAGLPLTASVLMPAVRRSLAARGSGAAVALVAVALVIGRKGIVTAMATPDARICRRVRRVGFPLSFIGFPLSQWRFPVMCSPHSHSAARRIFAPPRRALLAVGFWRFGRRVSPKAYQARGRPRLLRAVQSAPGAAAIRVRTLCHGSGGQGRGHRLRRAFMLPILILG